MDATVLSGLAGAGLSLGFSYIPGLSDRFEAKTPTAKRGIMAIGLIVITGVVFALGCTNIDTSVTCDTAGATGLLKTLGVALVVNQGTFLISPPKSPSLP